MDDGLVDVKGVAKLLAVSTRHVWALHRSERLPAPVRLGRSVRWRADELRAWIKAGCPSSDRWQAAQEVQR